MSTARTQPVKITRAVLKVYTRWRDGDGYGECTCPPEPPYPGGIFNSRIAEHRAAREQCIAMQRAYDAGSPCPSCQERLADEASLLQLLNVRLMPWQSSLQNCPELIAELEAAAEE